MKLNYLLLRLVRHFLPGWAAQFLLRRGWIIRPGLETSEPQAAVARYRETLEERGLSLAGKRTLVFGYGGDLAIGGELLRQGAAHVILCDKFALSDEHRNRRCLLEYGEYLTLDRGLVRPRPEFMTLLQADIRDLVHGDDFPPVDIVVSSSVYEHLEREDIESITHSLSTLTSPGGLHLHFIDLRDHFFKYPFEMLTFSERAWRHWLNPTSNLNRLRLTDYKHLFQRYFHTIDIQILEKDEEEFKKVRPRIRPEFLTGEPGIDTVTVIKVLAWFPRHD